MEPLEPARRRALRARAHHLDPVVTIGHHGLTPAVLHEIDVALTAHELVKVRTLGDDRAARASMIEHICDGLDCAAVQQIGKLLVLWRPRPPEAAQAAVRPKRRAGPAKRAPWASRKRAPLRREEAASPRATTHETGLRPRVPPGKAPKGVPRAALPRRRRSVV